MKKNIRNKRTKYRAILIWLVLEVLILMIKQPIIKLRSIKITVLIEMFYLTAVLNEINVISINF